MSELGTVVRNRRRALGWSLARLAAAAGCSKAYLSAIENAKGTGRLDVEFRLQSTATGTRIMHALGELERDLSQVLRGRRHRIRLEVDLPAPHAREPLRLSSRQTVVVVEGDRVQMRLLSSREAARLMGAPDDFKLPENYNDAYRAMGDGVCVPAVAWLAQHLLAPMTAIPSAGSPALDSQPLLHRIQQRADRWFRDRP